MTNCEFTELQEHPIRTMLHQRVAAWEPRPMPDGWAPTRPFTTEDGQGTPVTIPAWLRDKFRLLRLRGSSGRIVAIDEPLRIDPGL